MNTLSAKLPLYYISQSAVCGGRCVRIECIQECLRARSSIQLTLFEGSFMLWGDASRQMKLIYNDAETLIRAKMTIRCTLYFKGPLVTGETGVYVRRKNTVGCRK